jgi:hypothetical protein
MLKSGGRYNVHAGCTDALNAFLGSDEWKGISTPVDLVFLGAGAPSRENAVLTNLNERGKLNGATVSLIDLSFHMLKYSASSMYQLDVSGQKIRDIVHIMPFHIDFMDLGRISKHLNPFGRTCVYFMLGCAFANISEEGFMASFHRVARPGDILSIGVELWDGYEEETFKKMLITQYDHHEFKEFAIAPIKDTILTLYKDGGIDPPNDLTSNVKIDTANYPNHSNIEETITMVAEYIDQRIHPSRIVLGISSRYKIESMKRYLKGEGRSIMEELSMCYGINRNTFCNITFRKK